MTQLALPGPEKPIAARHKRREIERNADGSPVLTCLPTVHLYMHGSSICQCGAERVDGYVVQCIPGLPHGGHVWTSSAPEAICQCGAERYDGQALVQRTGG